MQDEVKVSQADREAAANLYLALDGGSVDPSDIAYAETVRQGRCDDSAAVQAFARHRHQAERDTLARMEWRDIESAPRDKYFLAVDDLADYREIHIAYRRKGDPKRKIRTSPHGRIYTATHWMNLPELPESCA